MPNFLYSAYDSSGQTVKGELVADNELAALDHIASENLIPVELREGRGDLRWWQRDLSISGRAEIRQPVLARFFQMFVIMLRAKYPMTKSLAFCLAQARDPRLRRVLERAQRQVADGTPLADALDDGNQAIPARYLRMIETGEASNQLAMVTERIATGLDEELRIRREIRQALVYPSILIVMSVLVVGLLVFYLTPTLMPVFLSSRATPPVMLSAMDSVRQFLVESWPICLVAIVVLALISYLSRARLKAFAMNAARRAPGLRSFLQKRQSLIFCQTMLQFLSAGERVQSALSQTQGALIDPEWQELLQNTHNKVVDGHSLAGALDDAELLDPMALAMIEAGEESDQLAETLSTAVSTLSDQTRQSLAQAVRLITPLLTLLIGLGVGAVILSTISAILDLNDITF